MGILTQACMTFIHIEYSWINTSVSDAFWGTFSLKPNSMGVVEPYSMDNHIINGFCLHILEFPYKRSLSGIVLKR